MNKRYYSSLIWGVLLLIANFGCKKKEGPIISNDGLPSCIAVRYVSTGATTSSNCQDIIQIMDPGFIAAHSTWLDTLQLPRRNEDGSIDNLVKVAYPNVMSTTAIPDGFKNANTFYITISSVDSATMQPAICIWTHFTAKYTGISYTGCATSGTRPL
ncbi:hypothetical protein CLV59_107224 [Chitinophaga dinghuensis]|uniref:Uncharacterized protein n=1 Tax=Chitinophaga dinghuensis TaxID=1539050 RepID=A0A327VSW1_9BACT|nr:hypothetical protein [Chitinophaga dinghuensis]RAJ77457.1 hypothetical protein CLV59_107224 [Chitinophaga dinghuensis]